MKRERAGRKIRQELEKSEAEGGCGWAWNPRSPLCSGSKPLALAPLLETIALSHGATWICSMCSCVYTVWFADLSWIPVLLLAFFLFTNETKMKRLRDEYLDKTTWRRPDILNGQGSVMCPSQISFQIKSPDFHLEPNEHQAVTLLFLKRKVVRNTDKEDKCKNYILVCKPWI